MAKKKKKKKSKKKSRKSKKKKMKKIKGFSIRFMPFSEIRDLNSDGRIKKILDIILGNNILILQGKLHPDEETRLIGDTMAMIDHVKGFRGIELAVISEKGNSEENEGIAGWMNRMRTGLLNALGGGDLGAVTIIGPANVVKEIKRNPKKIELFLNK